MTKSLLDTEPDAEVEIPLDQPAAADVEIPLEESEPEIPLNECDCIASGNAAKPKQHGADPHAKNCAVYTGTTEPAPQALGASVALALPVMEVLPADFPLPLLTRFVPDRRLKEAAEQAAQYALSIEVTGPEGLAKADLAMDAVRKANKAITEHFEEPTSIAFDLHRSLTGARGSWCAPGAQALTTVGKRYADETMRLQRIENERRRKEQEEADRKAREDAKRAAEEAAAAHAPAEVVQELEKEAETAKAPPVQAAAPAVPFTGGRSRNTVVKTWKARIAGTPADAEPNPAIEELTPAQWPKVAELLKGIAEGTQPRAAVQIDWGYLNRRASADKGTLQIAGIEAFEDYGTRGKGSRAK